jgi:hypothetical protein
MTGAYRTDDVGEAPCQDCPNARKCRLGFACRAFAAWMATGQIDPSESRTPRRAIYQRLFPQDTAPMIDMLLAAARKPRRPLKAAA